MDLQSSPKTHVWEFSCGQSANSVLPLLFSQINNFMIAPKLRLWSISCNVMFIGQGFNSYSIWLNKNTGKSTEFLEGSIAIVLLALEDLGRYNLIRSSLSLHYYQNVPVLVSHVPNSFDLVFWHPLKKKYKINERYLFHHSIFNLTENGFLALVNKTYAWYAQILSLA